MPIKKTLQYMDKKVLQILFAVLLLSTACSQQQPPASIDILKVGILPGQEKATLKKKYSALLDYISTEISIPYELIIADSYRDLLDKFREEKINLALMGGVTFIQAHKTDGAVPLVSRDVDAHFKSIVLVSNDHPAKTIHDLKGASFSFGARLSTSGHYMPRYFFNKQGIDAEKFFSEIKYSGSHHKTALWVRNGVVDAGVSNAEIVREMFKNGTLSLNTTRILWETPPYSDYVWVVQKNSSEHFINTLRDAFLKLSLSNAGHKTILMSVGAGYYLPASADDFNDVSKAIDMVNTL